MIEKDGFSLSKKSHAAFSANVLLAAKLLVLLFYSLACCIVVPL